MSDKKKIGPLGEELAVKFLMKQSYRILDRNYRRPWGELDIVAKKRDKIHFVEVKALSGSVKKRRVTCETLAGTSEHEEVLRYVRSGLRKDRFRPEENVSRDKIKRLRRIIQTYLMGKNVSDETPWQFDVVTVLVDFERKRARVEILEDVVL